MSASSRWLTRKRIGALLFFGLSLFYGWQIPDIPRLPVDALEAMNARSMPWALAILGVVLSIALFVTGGSETSSTSAQQDASEQDASEQDPSQEVGRQSSSGVTQPTNVLTAFVLLVWTALYASLLGWLGFFAATAVFLLGGFYLLGERQPAVLVGVALGAAGLLYALLRLGLGLYLPEASFWPWLTGATDV